MDIDTTNNTNTAPTVAEPVQEPASPTEIPARAEDGAYRIMFAGEMTEVEVHDKNEPYIPIEFALLGYNNSWKKCRCGRVAYYRDLWCPSCGQRLGKPELED